MLETITAPVPTSSSSTQVIVVPAIGFIVLLIPMVILLVGVILSVISNPAFRKPIGAVLSVVGVLEVVPFFINLVKDISRIIPFVPLLILFIVGCVTLICGVVIFYLSKQTPPRNIRTLFYKSF
jgi:predicted membrane channel-forming protein YqfA (hemolysin III family)